MERHSFGSSNKGPAVADRAEGRRSDHNEASAVSVVTAEDLKVLFETELRKELDNLRRAARRNAWGSGVCSVSRDGRSRAS